MDGWQKASSLTKKKKKKKKKASETVLLRTHSKAIFWQTIARVEVRFQILTAHATIGSVI